ncbi:MAG: flavodoxin family protein [Selenomonadaceae bacterium]|nr:flavodoxin family protein [Selenomonadaceae bacterium]
MKVLLVNGSPRAKGNTSIALNEMIKVFEAEGVETKYLHIGNKVIRGCVACQNCFKLGRCVFDDVVNEVAPYFMEAEGFVIGSPVYYGSPNGTMLAFLDRLFYSTFTKDKTGKVGAGVVVSRRGGSSAAFDVLNKYMAMTNMTIAGSQYWNMVYGMEPGEATQDAEGLQTMRTLARNMTFLMRSIALGKEKYGLPKVEPWTPTHFIR